MQVVQSEIQAVSVYSSGSVVTRVAELEASGGAWPLQVRIAGLPLALDDSSVKVRVEDGGANTRPSAVGFRVALEVLEAMAEPADEKALRAARRDALVLEGRLESLQRLISRLTQLPLPARPVPRKGEAPPPSPHAGRMALLDFQRKKLRTLNSAAEEAGRKLRGAQEALAAAEDRGLRASAAREPRPNELRKTVVVSLNPPRREGGGTARLLLEYHVPGARWAPAYALHFNADFSHATLSVRAVVAQRTGEDWKNIRLTLSTAQMQAWTELPELASIRLGRWQPPLSSGWRPLPPGADELYADCDREAAAIGTGAVKRKKLEDTGEFALPEAAPTPALPPETKPVVYEGRPVVPVAAARGLGALLFSRGGVPADTVGRVRQPAAAPVASPPPQEEFTRIHASLPPAAAPPPSPAPGVPALSIPEPTMRPASASLDYAALHMPGPGEPGRGKLTRMELAASVEVITELRVNVKVDTVDVLQAARSDAAQVGGLPLAHSFPSSVDGFDYAYRAELPVDIPSDGRFHTIPIVEHETDSRPHYVTVPRETSDVFRFAEIDNPLEAPLLSGPADIYVDNAFLMTVPLRLTPAKGVIRVGMGVEQRIKAARNAAFVEEASGLMGGTLNLKHDIDIELRNLLRVAARIEVRERVPVTRDGEEHLKVSAAAKPPWEPYDPPEGLLRGGYVWKVQIQPSEVMHLHAAYVISMPAKMEIATGNRRER